MSLTVAYYAPEICLLDQFEEEENLNWVTILSAYVKDATVVHALVKDSPFLDEYTACPATYAEDKDFLVSASFAGTKEQIDSLIDTFTKIELE